MQPPSRPLLTAREQAGLSREEMADLVGLPAADLPALEEGPRYVPPEIIERYALALGMSVHDLLHGDEPSAVALLFRRISRESGDPNALTAFTTHRTLGEFVRSARDYARLRALLDEAPDHRQLRWLDLIPPEPLAPRPDLFTQARRLASRVRTYLDLDDTAVIPSMRQLVDGLGIVTMFVEPEQLDPQIEGASLLDPHPAILVNLVSGGENWWKTRMILAHELCHMLFDRAELHAANPRKFFLFSPFHSESRPATAWRLFDHFDDLEARANAFAGDLLAPTSGVERLIGAEDPTALDAIDHISDHFQIGHVTAINRLQNTFRLSREQRTHMLSRLAMARASVKRRPARAAAHPDYVATGAQLRDTTFIDAVMRAHQAGKLGGIEARRYLNLRASDPLPFGDQEPILSAEALARKAAERHLYRRASLDHFVHAIDRTGDIWEAQIRRITPEGADKPAGVLRMRSDLSLLEEPHHGQ